MQFNFQPSGTTPDQSNVGSTPFGLGGLGGLGGIGGLGMGSANFMEMQQRMQREVGIECISRFISTCIMEYLSLVTTH